MNDNTVAASDGSAAGEVGAGGTASVGRRLREARESAGLTVAEIAQSLKFSARQIQLLEADDYAALPGNTIVRGFVRSYARLLKLDADSLLQAIEASIPSAPIDVRPPENMGVAAQPGSLRELSPIVLVAVVLLMAAVLLALWHFFGPSATRPGDMASWGESAPQQQKMVSGGESSRAGQPPLAVPAAAPAAEPASAQAPNVASENPAPVLRFAFAERAWLEVTDATKQVLHSGENPAGSQLTLTGRPPFEMVIGNASKVTLTYGERVLDLAPYTRAEVARIKLE